MRERQRGVLGNIRRRRGPKIAIFSVRRFEHRVPGQIDILRIVWKSGDPRWIIISVKILLLIHRKFRVSDNVVVVIYENRRRTDHPENVAVVLRLFVSLLSFCWK